MLHYLTNLVSVSYAPESLTTSAVTAEKKVASNLSVFLQRNTTKVTARN